MIEFFNIRTGERRTVDTEPMMSAFYNSTDQHVNAKVGQDMGWRIGASTIKRIEEIKQDATLMNKIALTFQIPPDEVKETDILYWISIEAAREKTEQASQKEGDFTQQYEDEIRAVRDPAKSDPEPSKPAEEPKNETPDEIDIDPEDTYPLNKPLKPSSKKQRGSAKIEKSTDNS